MNAKSEGRLIALKLGKTGWRRGTISFAASFLLSWHINLSDYIIKMNGNPTIEHLYILGADFFVGHFYTEVTWRELQWEGGKPIWEEKKIKITSEKSLKWITQADTFKTIQLKGLN